MKHAYDDEDNAPMTEDAWEFHNPTVYIYREEMKAYDSGEADRIAEERENAREIMQSQLYEGFLDDMEIPRGSACRECPWMKEGILEAYESEALDDMAYPSDVYDLAHRMCAVCNAHKDDSEEERWQALEEFFREEDEKNGNS